MACVRKRREKWVLDFRDLQRKRHWESYSTQKKANAALIRRGKELEERAYISPREAKTFADLCQAFTKAHKPDVKENTWSDYETNMRLHLVPYFGRCKLHDILHIHVEVFRADCLEQGLGKPTVTKCIKLLVSLFKYAGKHRWVHTNPAQGLTELKVDELGAEDEMDRVILSPVKFQRLLDSIIPKYRLIVKMAGLTGLRQGELIGLPWKYVDFDKRKVKVRQQYTARRFSTLKTKKSRRDVPLSTGLANELREHWLASKWKGPEDLVLANTVGKPLGLKLLFKSWKDALRKAKLEDRKFHSLRHSYASALIRKEVNMKVVSTLCGHSSITITMDTYSHLLPDETDGIGELLADEMLGGGKK